MIDAHIHIFHGNCGEYSIELIERFVSQAQSDYNEYQKNWLSRKTAATLETYIHFVENMRCCRFPIMVKF